MDWPWDSYTYGLHGTPTTFTLEAQLANIEGGNHCVLAPSGLAAITIVDMAFLKTGDDVLIPENIYNPNRELGNWLSKDFGVSVRYYDPLIGAGIADLILPNTRLIWAETPGSITMEVRTFPLSARQPMKKGLLSPLTIPGQPDWFSMHSVTALMWLFRRLRSIRQVRPIY